MPHILVVDDDRAVRASLERALRLHDFETSLAADGMQALAMIREREPDVVVLDVNMPGVDGHGVTRRLRADGLMTPVLMLTAKDGIPDRVAGLDAGADDYLVKPFALEELVARLHALLRRVDGGQAVAADVRRYADLHVDVARATVCRADRSIDLTRTEFDLLLAFLDQPERVLTRDNLHEIVWGVDMSASNTVEVYVGYLRKKLEADGEARLIQTVRGFGYALRER